jgi:GH15 family glucan-1,4-alpha-glucosidase
VDESLTRLRGHVAGLKTRGQRPLHGAKIEDYCLIGDCETAALVSREGSIDWLCWPKFSSGACFAALMGTKEQGFWKIAPKAKVKDVLRRYEEHTLIVETVFETARGEVKVTDFMPPRGRYSDVVRVVRGVRGKVAMRMVLAIRFDYGRTIPWVTSRGEDWQAAATITPIPPRV